MQGKRLTKLGQKLTENASTAFLAAKMVPKITSPATRPLCDRIGLKHLRAVTGRVLDLGVVTQQVCPLLQRLDPLLNHGPQDRDAV